MMSVIGWIVLGLCGWIMLGLVVGTFIGKALKEPDDCGSSAAEVLHEEEVRV